MGAKKFDGQYLLSKMAKLGDRSEARRSLESTARQAAAFAERFPDAAQVDQARIFAQLPYMSPWQRRQTIVRERFFKIGMVRNLAWLGLT
ncbi:hypothetical protein GCM10010841_28370 [Deinococcus aerophilus]|uniref:Uncharacterized protein n=1 Tax=Deinococcus aerophilus TaxID=522488 RepID=A0ABQ2GZ94_9DEIO|nr:hypothetical protein GCM10010841_28370 [Deinococcus aerophilus]